MRFVVLAVIGTAVVVVACTGGGGAINQGGDNGDQNNSITGDPSGQSSISVDGTKPPTTASPEPTPPSSSGADPAPTKTYTPQADLHANEYDQSCTQDFDCYPVKEGVICNPCACDNAAVATKDYVKFVMERSKRTSECDPATLTGGACAPCPASGAHCNTGSKKCEFGKTIPDGGTKG